MAEKSKQPLASSFFQLIRYDEYKDQLHHTVPLGPLSSSIFSQKEKTKSQWLHNKLKMRASQNRKKAKKIQEGKRDLDGHFIKPSQDAFDVLSQVRDRFTTNINNMALTTNYSREHIWKQKMSINPTDFIKTLLSLPIKRKHIKWFHPYIWLTIDMAGRYTNYLSCEVVKHF